MRDQVACGWKLIQSDGAKTGLRLAYGSHTSHLCLFQRSHHTNKRLFRPRQLIIPVARPWVARVNYLHQRHATAQRSMINWVSYRICRLGTNPIWFAYMSLLSRPQPGGEQWAHLATLDRHSVLLICRRYSHLARVLPAIFLAHLSIPKFLSPTHSRIV